MPRGCNGLSDAGKPLAFIRRCKLYSEVDRSRGGALAVGHIYGNHRSEYRGCRDNGGHQHSGFYRRKEILHEGLSFAVQCEGGLNERNHLL